MKTYVRPTSYINHKNEMPDDDDDDDDDEEEDELLLWNN